MAKLTKSERTGLCLLALILAVLLACLAFRRPTNPAYRTIPTIPTDSVTVSVPADTVVRKKSKPKSAPKRVPKRAPAPRRHLDEPF